MNDAESQVEPDGPTIDSVEGLLAHVSGSRADRRTKWYRGQAKTEWLLVPRLARNRGHLEAESDMLKLFQQDAGHRVQRRPATQWEWICLAQHYGLPTRLLDWTENPLIALYFAVEDEDAKDDGAFFELDPQGLNRSSHADAPGVIMFDEDEFLQNYLPSAIPGPKLGPVAVIAGRSFDRIIAQVGTFTVNHGNADHPDLTGSDHVTKIRIPASRKPHIRAALADLNINAGTVYPDLSRLAQFINESYAT